MADTPLAGLLDRAGEVFGLANSLGWDFQQAHREQGGFFEAGAESPRKRYHERIADFENAVQSLQDEITNPPTGFDDVAEQLRKAGKLAREWSQLDHWDLLEKWPKLNQLGFDGYQAVKELRESQRLDDPWAFLDEPAAINKPAGSDAPAPKGEIRATGNSPLSRYVDLLVAIPANLELLLDRDAEAVRILTANPALHEAIGRVDRWYWDRQREKQTGESVPTSRIWTRRDELRVNMLRGLRSGCWPACRAARYLEWLVPRSGPSLHDQWFRLAIDEARRDGTAAVLCPKLDETKRLYDALITSARSISQDDGGRPEFDSARIELGNLACGLMDWTKTPEEPQPANMQTTDVEVKQPQISTPTAAHSTDFRSVNWYGTIYEFTPTQAACVRELWKNWEQGTPVVGEATILEAADSSSDRLRDVFSKDHAAWGTLIQPAGKGAFKLVEPENP